MSRKLIATLRGFVAVVLMLFATNFLPVAAAFADSSNGNSQNNVVSNTNVSSSLNYTGQGIPVDQQCDAQSDPYLLFVFTGGSATNVQLHGITVTNTKVTNGSVHFTTPYVNPPSSLINQVYVTWDGDAGNNPQLVISHGCAGTTTPVDTVITPPTLHTDVVCGADNDVTTLVDSSDSAHYTVSQVGSVYTVTAKTGFTFSTGKTVTLSVPVDSNTTCLPVEVAIPPVPSITDLCGTGNASWNVPANTDQVKYILGSDGHLRVHTIFGFIFSDGTHSHDYGVAVETNTQSCDVCSNIKGIQTEVPEGKVLVDGKCKNVKVFVCKYVGTPGVNERLKDGKNPISVSVKSTGGTAVGSYFNDAQGRSFVLGIDDGTFHPTSANCPPAQQPVAVTPAVSFSEPTCENTNGRVTVTAMTGVTYKVNGAVVTGTTSYAAGSSVTVTATLAQGFVLASGAHDSFSHTFSAAPTGCVLGATDVCPNITGDQATVPTGMTKDSATGDCITTVVTGGRGGDVLGASTTAQLANTGQSPWASILIGLTVLATAVGLTIATRRQYRLDA